MRRLAPILALLATLSVAESVSAQVVDGPVMGVAGVGLGNRMRFTPGALQIDVYGDRLVVDDQDGLRRHLPLGLSLAMPVGLTERLSLRPQLGVSAVYSSFDLLDGGDAGRTDDLLIGISGGAGLELEVTSRLAAFWDVSAVGYLGQVHNAGGFLGTYEQERQRFAAVQSAVGLRARVGS